MITFIESGNRIATENFETGEIYTITYTLGNHRTMCCIGIGTDFVMFQGTSPNALFCLTLGTSETVSIIELGGGGSETMNYNELENKPQINGVVLIGNKSAADLNLASITDLNDKQDILTDIQLTAVNSGITSSLVTQIGTNTTAISGKQDQLSTAQLTAVNSGITSSLVTQIGTNTTAISGKQDQLSTTQLTAVNSGITSSLVTQIGTNTTAISGKQDQLSTTQLTAVNSGITSRLVTQIGTNTTAISGKQDHLSTTQLTAVNSGITRSLVTQITTNKNNISMIESVALTYVNNSYVDSTAFNRCTAYQVSPNLAIMAVNLQQIIEPSTQMADFATIGTLPFYVKQATFASQDKLTLYLTGNTIKIYINGADGTSKYNLRQTIPIVIDLSVNQ